MRTSESEILRAFHSLAERWEPASRLRDRLDAAGATIGARVRAITPRTWRRMGIGAGLLAVLLAVLLFLALRPIPTPDYEYAELDDLFAFTLLTDEFNRLPIDKRLELLSKLIERVKGMSSGESALLAAFAAGVKGKLREQLLENASRLAMDTWDKFAREYEKVPSADRAAFLDQTFVDFTRMMETLAGEESGLSDEERLAQAREQSQREERRRADPGFEPSGEGFGRAFNFMREDVGRNAPPAQRARGQQMLRDMTRRFRGEDVR